MEFEARAQKARAWYRRTRSKDDDPRLAESLELAASKSFKEALATVERVLEERSDDSGAMKVRARVVELQLWDLVDAGVASWSGGKPKGSKHPVKLTPGPSITEMVFEARR